MPDQASRQLCGAAHPAQEWLRAEPTNGKAAAEGKDLVLEPLLPDAVHRVYLAVKREEVRRTLVWCMQSADPADALLL